ncbi:MAG: hypothetical protein II350_05455 [Clostridia bacterium]|nr:hypothetical protein [Clostridia bacterium]
MNTESIKKEFTNPSIAYRGKPFWSWNGELRGEELVRQTRVMKEMGLGGYFMHSRAGLITEYLGEEWFELINEVADAAEKDGMEAWLYDEDRWPSGSAGGKVTVDEQYRMKSLYVFESAPEKYTHEENTVALFVAKTEGINIWAYERLVLSSFEEEKTAIDEKISTLSAVNADAPGEWKVLRFAIVPDAPSSNYNGTTYIDTMSLAATNRFIELTHEEYKKHCGDRIGRSIKGIFTDEPHRGALFGNAYTNNGVFSCGICWTDDIFEEFEKRYGFDPVPLLPELFYRLHGEKVAPVKLFYIDLADNLFLERFAAPINKWCEDNNMILTGHVLHEDSLMNQTIPHGSLMRFYEHMGYPGVDCLSEDNRAYWIVKQLTSAARQLGKKWLLSELYGCTGWQFNFKSHKAVGDWQALFGINVRCPHLSWYTMEGESKRDYPASILHQSPWYGDYSKVEDYFARFGLVMSEGDPDCDVLLLNPIESVWCQAYVGWANWIFNNSEDIAPFEDRYARTFHILADNQIDFDYGEEEMMSRMASVETDENGNALLRVGKAKYRTVIVTNMITIRPTTLDLLEEFASKGGKIIFAGFVPEYVNAERSSRPALLAQKSVCTDFCEAELVSAIRESSNCFVSVLNKSGETEKSVFAQVRKNFGKNGCAVVLLNTDRNNPRKDLTLKLFATEKQKLTEWNLENGEMLDAASIGKLENGVLSVSFGLDAAGTRCFVLSEEDEKLPSVSEFETVEEKIVSTEFDFSLSEKNVCVLDWVRWRFDGGEQSEEEEALWADRHIRDSLGLERRGGEMLQPWFAKLNDTKVYGKLSLVYEFNIEKLPEGEIFLAGERPEFNSYSINGVPLAASGINEFWVDDCFKKMPIPNSALKPGLNEVRVSVDFMRTTNVEAIYLVGDFGVKLEGKKRTLVALPEKVGCLDYANYDLPFYTGALTYHLTPEMYANVLSDIKSADRIVLSPVEHTGGCVKVSALGKTTVLGWDPYEADVTEAVLANSPIDVTVVGTRRNVFGPLHQFPAIVGAYGPGNFVTSGSEWTDDYSLISSGLRGIAFKAQKKK